MSKAYEFVTKNVDYGSGSARLYINPNTETIDIDPDTIDWVQIKPITTKLLVRKVKKMKLKNGKKYETADGVVYRVRYMNDDFFDESDGSPLLWRHDGSSSGVASPDLIRRHYAKPKPAHKLDLKPGDVVELVAWEDGGPLTHALKLTYDGTSLIGDFHNVIRDHSSIPKGERPLFRVVSRS